MKSVLISVFIALFISEAICAATVKTDEKPGDIREAIKNENNTESVQGKGVEVPSTGPTPKPTVNFPPESTPTPTGDKTSTTTTTTATTNTTPSAPTTSTTPTTPTTTVPTPSPTTTTPASTTVPTPKTSTVSPPPTHPPTTTTPNTTTPYAPTTASPPSKRDRHFDGWSFFAGIVLSAGLLATGVVVYKFYESRGRNYHTL